MIILNWYSIVMIVKIIYAFMILGYFSILDIKYRDIPDRLIWSSLGLSILFLLISIPYYIVYVKMLNTIIFLTTILVEGLIVSMLILLYFYDLIGGADVVVISELLLLFPLCDLYGYTVLRYECILHIPPVLIALIYASISFVVIFPVKALITLIKYRRFIPRDLSLSKKIILVFTGTVVPVSRYLGMKHYYPLTVFNVVDGRVVKGFRSTFNISEDYWIHQERLKKLIDEKLISPDEPIWVTYGIPFIVPLLIGYTILILMGDSIFLWAMGIC